MKRTILVLLMLSPFISVIAQKKGKGKGKVRPPVNFEKIAVNDMTPVADTATKFSGIIKYSMTSDDPADKDSMFIIFGVNKIRITMFTPGYKEGQIFETHMIADFNDSTLYTLEPRNKSYKIEKLADRNSGTGFSLINSKKTAPILKIICTEFSGEMQTSDGEVYQAACLLSKQHSFIYTMDYNFLNIQPVVMGYRIVLGWRTKTADNENTYIMAYKIEPGEVSNYFDLTGYKVK